MSLQRVLHTVSFLAKFLWVFIQANLSVAYTVLFVPKAKIKSTIADYGTPSLTDREMILMAHLITLTPGSLVVEVDLTSKNLRVHFLNCSDIDNELSEIKHRIEIPLLKVTRP